MNSRAFSDLMARNGYLVVALDFRGYDGGDGPNPFYTGCYADVLGLIPLAQKLPVARGRKIDMGGIAVGQRFIMQRISRITDFGSVISYRVAANLTRLQPVHAAHMEYRLVTGPPVRRVFRSGRSG